MVTGGMDSHASGVRDGPVTWTPERREVAFMLEGSARIETGGRTIDVSPGDLFSLAPGVETTWHITAPFKEIWFLADRRHVGARTIPGSAPAGLPARGLRAERADAGIIPRGGELPTRNA
jgi:hypothetical protein